MDNDFGELIRRANEHIADCGGPRPDWERERDSEAGRWGDSGGVAVVLVMPPEDN